MNDLISRTAAIDAMEKLYEEDLELYGCEIPEMFHSDRAIEALNALPSAQPTLYGYNVEHLILIASVLQKENLPPERITEALTDIGRVVAIVRDEFVDNLRKAVENAGFDKQTVYS